MSRIGKMPITVPAGVEVTIADGNLVTVKGPKGTLTSKFHHDMIIKQEGAVLTVSRPDEEHEHKSLHGLTRTPLPLLLPAKWQNPIPLASPAVGMLILITAALGVMMSCII